MNTHEPILNLRSPKLLTLRYFSDNSNSFSADHLENSVDYLSFDDREAKQEKSAYEVSDFLETKKSKVRQRKKKKNKISLDRSEELPNVQDELVLNETQINDTSTSSNSKSKNCLDNMLHSRQDCADLSSLANDIYIDSLITVQELAAKLRIHSSDIIKWLFLQGISVTINQLLDISVSTLVAQHYSFNVLQTPSKNDTATSMHLMKQSGRLRAPIIALLGHVDHGKTTLIKAIGKSNAFLKEAGDITQSICSYEIFVSQNSRREKLIFLDTPGHEAFAGMRQRGISIADLAILVVSAADGLQPQTYEAISYIQEKNIPFVVAINKIDKQDANISRTRKQLIDAGIESSSLRINSAIIEVSALSCENIDLLLSTLIRLSKTQDLKSDPSLKAEGVILEAYLSKQKGSIAQLLVRNGTLFVGDVVLAGNSYGKVKAISDSAGQKIQSIESAALAEILCFNEVPNPGLLFKVVDNEKIAKTLALDCRIKMSSASSLNHRISLDDSSRNYTKAVGKQANFIIKTATQGAIDPILYALSSLSQSKVQINLLLVASGEVSLKDIELASTSDSVILLFGLSISSRVVHVVERKNVTIKTFGIIYDLLSYVESYMLQFVDLDYEKQILGQARVRSLFPVKHGIVAGCFVLIGRLKRKSYFQVKRDNRHIYTGSLDSLKKVKDDVDEVLEGNECGVMCNEYSLWENEDLIECYELKPLKKVL